MEETASEPETNQVESGSSSNTRAVRMPSFIRQVTFLIIKEGPAYEGPDPWQCRDNSSLGIICSSTTREGALQLGIKMVEYVLEEDPACEQDWWNHEVSSADEVVLRSFLVSTGRLLWSSISRGMGQSRIALGKLLHCTPSGDSQRFWGIILGHCSSCLFWQIQKSLCMRLSGCFLKFKKCSAQILSA
jgi:hypothetical protein